ncbi:MAG: hypothetical protein M4579_000555 [Chaenotheca gracillima]|nr:MAG: hypothetical protein M4579_000555 [Chaenotheca gracillima]
MPNILNYTPAWLSRPSRGFDLFSPISDSRRNSASRARSSSNAGLKPSASRSYPRRIVARRGTEVFVVVNNQIRWADLSTIKNDWEEKNWRESKSKGHGGSGPPSDGDSEDSGPSYRILRTPVSEEIRQLVTSPTGDMIAILTSHTVHVAILPDPSHLGGPDTGPIRLRAHTLGPTAHVMTQSPVISALWHPLGVSGHCLVTVTAEAVVRVWELAAENRWSFDNPAMAVDLKKLVDGAYAEDDYGASSVARNKGFSPDSFEMEVAAACFGGSASPNESGWAPMTLWVAMSEGDVYALCPLLPSKWQPPDSLIPSLSISVVSKASADESDKATSEQDKRDAKQQFAWMSELDEQEPVFLPKRSEYEPDTATYVRPTKPGVVPKLQGPFDIELTPEETEKDMDVHLTDIYVAAAKLDGDELMFDEEASDFGDDEAGLSVAVVCLLNSTGRVQVCLDVEGVEGKWLPSKKSKSRFSLDLDDDEDGPSLLAFESLDTLRASELTMHPPSWPTFSSDPYSRYSFFVTHGHAITYMSLTPWLENLESELKNTSDSGVDFRIAIMAESGCTLRQRIFTGPIQDDASLDGLSQDLSAATIFRDSDLGYFVLTTREDKPYALTLFAQEFDDTPREVTPFDIKTEPQETVAITKPREPYQPHSAFWQESPLPAFLEKHANGRLRRTLTEEIRLSQTTLSLMTDAHKVLSESTHKLGVAASELFRRCERLQEEFRGQIQQTNEIADRIENVTGEDADDLGSEQSVDLRGTAAIERRIELARERQAGLLERYDVLRRRVSRHGGRELSDKEKSWIAEVDKMKASVLESDDEGSTNHRRSHKGANLPWKRFQEAKELASSLLTQAQEVVRTSKTDTGAEDGSAAATPAASEAEVPNTPTSRPSTRRESASIRIPTDIRKMKMAQVMKMLDRESALVDATKNRLEKLTLTE